jgi:D-amino peptidase
MKVYITVDMEGASGICCREQTDRSHPLYQEGRRLLTGDVNAAVEGALAGGATEVIVADMHSSSFNLIPDQVHAEAKVVYGVPHAGPRFPYLDRSVDMLFVVAYHAKSGTQWGTLEHTMSSLHWRKVVVNGQEIGELGIDAGLAGAVGVPVTLVTGDDKVCREARQLLGKVETAEVKQGLGRHRALCLAPGKAQALIKEAAERATRLKGKIKPLVFKSPVAVAITYKHTENADGAALADPNEKRIDAFTVVKKYRHFADWYGGTWEQRKGK